MASRSNGPITMTFPPFRGITRRIILIALAVFFASYILPLVSKSLTAHLLSLLLLNPQLALHGFFWQFITYPFVSLALLNTAFALLSFWFFAAVLEDERGSRWLGEYFVVTSVAGGLLACLLAYVSNGRVPGIDPFERTFSLWPAVLAVLVAYAIFHADEDVNFDFIFHLKAKYLAAIFVLFYLGSTLAGGDRFGALTAVCAALSGYLYLRLAPRRGLRFAVSERWFSARNSYYRSKRQRAARKFKVYMGKQGKDVSIDDQGNYIDPSGKPRDPNDKSWMN